VVKHLVLASTTSHKREALGDTLDIFGRLGLTDVDLNLHPLMEEGVPLRAALDAAAAAKIRVHVVSGGWCDFFHGNPQVQDTERSVAKQVAIGDALGARTLRLFFGRLEADRWSDGRLDQIVGNLRRLSDRHPETLFVFENHDGASLRPEICREVFERTDRPNIRMNFDPINFERAGVDGLAALSAVAPFVAHMHLKGLEGGEFCEFGAGDVDLAPVLQALVERGYAGAYTVEFEGRGDGTLRLHRSVRRARAAVAELLRKN